MPRRYPEREHRLPAVIRPHCATTMLVDGEEG